MLELVLVAALSSLAAQLGARIALAVASRKAWVGAGIGLSAGVMLAISLFDLIPASLAAAGILETAAAIVAGFLLVLLADSLFSHQHFIKEHGRLEKAGWMVAAGMIIHDFPEGFAIASAYAVSASAGLLLALAVVLHNIPEGFAMGMPFAMGKKRNLAFEVAFLVGVSQLLGAITGASLAAFSPALSPLLMAFAAGAMIFVSIDELLPMAEKYSVSQTFIGVALGVAAYFVLAALI